MATTMSSFRCLATRNLLFKATNASAGSKKLFGGANIELLEGFLSSTLAKTTLRPISATAKSFRPFSGDDEDDDLKSNPYYDKYAAKIKEVKEMKTSRPMSTEQISYRMNYEAKKWKNHMKNMEQKMESKKESLIEGRSSLPKRLDDILKLDQVAEKNKDEIGHIWTEYFKSKQSISAVIPSEIYERIYSRAMSCPTFIYPLVKDQGFEFILGQFRENQCFFTSLLNFQVHGENAPWQMNMTHYTELMDDKGIVLMLGEIDSDKMNILEAQCLAQQVQMFYATADEERFNLVYTFNHEPDKFKYMDVVKEVEASRLIESLHVTQ